MIANVSLEQYLTETQIPLRNLALIRFWPTWLLTLDIDKVSKCIVLIKSTLRR
jgi:hypothetical protein